MNEFTIEPSKQKVPVLRIIIMDLPLQTMIQIRYGILVYW